MTAFSAAFSKAGLDTRDVEFDIAIAKYLNSGGTIDGMRSRIDVAAQRMPDVDLRNRDTLSVRSVSTVRQPVEGDEAERGLQSSRTPHASSPSSNRGGEGQRTVAENCQVRHALPVREPTLEQRSAALAVAKISVMDTLRIDGRPIGDWTVSEARKAGHDKTREGYILLAASRFVANARGFETIRSVMKAEQMQQIIQKAAEVADAV